MNTKVILEEEDDAVMYAIPIAISGGSGIDASTFLDTGNGFLLVGDDPLADYLEVA